MAQEETGDVRMDPLGEDDAEELAIQYRSNRGGEVVEMAQPISQVEPDHWHSRADRSLITAAELGAIREKYQIPVEVELWVPKSTERPSDVRVGAFSLYEEALKGGLRLPLPQIVVDVLNHLEVAPGQLMPNAWKILLACASAWPRANGGVAMTVEEFFGCYKASGQQETWITLQALAGKGLVAGLPTSIKGWRPRWFYVSIAGGAGVRTIWKVPAKYAELKLGATAEERVKKVKEWREKEKVKWDELVQPSVLFEAGLGPKPIGEDLDRSELEVRRKAQEAEDQTMLVKAQKFKEAQADRPPQPVARERIRPRPKPLGEKGLGESALRLLPKDPLKERSLKEMEALGVGKKKKRLRRGGEEPAQKRRKEVRVEGASLAKQVEGEGGEVEQTPEGVVVSAGEEVLVTKDTPEVAIASPTVDVVEKTPVEQVGAGQVGGEPSGMLEKTSVVPTEVRLAGVEPSRREQTQGGSAPQEMGAGLGATTYHARAVAGRLEGDGGPARSVADRLVKMVDETALRSACGFNEADLLRGLYSAQMEVTTLAGALLRKAGAAKLKAEETKAQLASLQKESADWKTAHTDLQAVKLELEGARRQVVSLEFQLAAERQRLEETKKACDVAVERHEEAMNNNEDLVRQRDEADAKVEALQKAVEEKLAKAEEEKVKLRRELEVEGEKARAERERLRKEVEEERVKLTAEGEAWKRELEVEKAKAAAENEALQKELNEEKAKAASERAAYPDLYVAAVTQFKGSPEFQMAIDAAVAASLAELGSGGAGSSGTGAGVRTESEIINSFQQSDYYKHEMAEYWDSGWKMFKRKAEELFPDLDLSSVVVGEDDVAQTPLDEGIEEADLISSEEEE